MGIDRVRAALLSDAASFKALALFRIGIAAVLLAQSAVLWQYREFLLNEYGPVPWIISNSMVDPVLPKLSYWATALAPYGIDSARLVELTLGAHMLAGAGLLLGFKVRLSAVLAWATHLVLFSSGKLFTYGLGTLLLIGLFYCIFMPVGRAWSLDARGSRAREAESADASFSVLVLRIHMCIIYAAAGVTKAAGEQWWTGEAIWRAISLPQFQQYDLDFLLRFPLLLQIAGIGALVVQLLYPLLVWTRWRVAIVAATELLHLVIAIFLGLWLFSIVMIVFNLGAFGESLWRAFTRILRSGGPLPSEPTAGNGSREITIIYDGGCPFCTDYVRYQDLQASAKSIELVDARMNPGVLDRHGIPVAALEDGMVVIVDGRLHHGAEAVHALSNASSTPRRWWIAPVALLSRSGFVARALYPVLRLGRRVALAILGIPRFRASDAGRTPSGPSEEPGGRGAT